MWREISDESVQSVPKRRGRWPSWPGPWPELASNEGRGTARVRGAVWFSREFRVMIRGWVTAIRSLLTKGTRSRAPFAVAVAVFAFAIACSSASNDSPSGAPTGSGTGGASIGGAWGTGGANVMGAGGAAPGIGGAQSGNGGATDAGSSTVNGGASSTGTGGDTSVVFDWPETIPGQAKPCKAGHYTGTFACNYQPAGTPDGSAGGLPITGPIDFTLQQSQNGEFLEVSGGTLDGLALLAIHFKATIVGKLSCSTGAFAGNLENGSYAIDPFPAGGTFVGPMSGFSSSTPPCTGICLSGNWALHETGAAGTNHIGTCAGTWTATLQP